MSDIGIVFISVQNIKVKNKLPELYAQIHCDDSQILCTKLNYQKKVGYSQKNVNLYWISYILRTKSNILADKPREVRISTDSQCNSLTSPIQIQDDNPRKTYTFGVCLHKSVYNIKDPQILIDWIELYLVLGAEFFTIYFQDVPEIFYEVMKPYINEGLVEILEWRLKSTVLSGTDVFWGQFSLINDCIYHNLYRVKYLALMDMDEFIIPQNKSYFKITDMLPTLQKLSPDAATYVFLHTNFLSDGVTLPEVNKSLKCSSMSWPRYFTQTLRSSDPVGDGKKYPNHKLIVQPKAVVAVDVHIIVEAKKGYTPQYHVPISLGLLFHFRYKPRFNSEKKERSLIMSRYFNQTFRRLKNKMC